MHRRHKAALEAELIQQDLDDRSEAVGGAARIGDDAMLRRVIRTLVDAENNRDVLVLSRSGDDDLASTGGQVLGGVVPVGKAAGRFDHDIDAEILPGQRSRVLLREDLDLVTIYKKRLIARFDGAGIDAVDRVIL